MQEHTVTRSVIIPMPQSTQFRRDLELSLYVPIVALVLFVARQQTKGIQNGAPMLLDGWSQLATNLIGDLGATPDEIQFARKTAQRAIRIIQGHESVARDRGFQACVDYLEGKHGVDRPLTDEECVALNNAMYHAFCVYGVHLDHAGSIGGRL